MRHQRIIAQHRVSGLHDVVDADERQPREQKKRDDDIDRRIAVEIGKQQDQGNRDDGRENEEPCRQRQ